MEKIEETSQDMYEAARDERMWKDYCIKKWGGKGFLENYASKDTKEIMAQLYERQESHQLTAKRKSSLFTEADQLTTTLPTSVFPTRIVYPLLDQVFPNLIAMKIAQVKPMKAATARFIYRDYQFSTGPTNFTHIGSGASTSEVGTVPLARTLLTKADITAVKYSLRARYSLELIEDAIAEGLDFENELIAAMRDEIIGEIDDLVIDAMVSGATATAVSWNSDYTTHSGETVKEHQKEIFDAVIDANNNVFTKMFRNADFIVGDPTAVGRLEKCEEFKVTPAIVNDVSQVASNVVGVLNNQWTVYKSTKIAANKLLVGISKMGYMFCPYVPLELTPETYYDATEELARGVRTRFGTKLTRGDCFSVITIS